MWVCESIDAVSVIDAGLAALFFLLGLAVLRAGIRLRRDADSLLNNAAVVWASVMRDEVVGLNELLLTIDDLIRTEPEREETLMMSRIQTVQTRDQLVRKAEMLDRFARGELNSEQAREFVEGN
jgi:hypothetical protein